MEGFDTITMSYLAAPMSLSSVTAADQLAMPLLPLDNLDHHSNYDNETFAGYGLSSQSCEINTCQQC